MFMRKKSVLQKQKLVVSIPSDVWSEIFRHFSRKQLCQGLYLVNRQLYDLANSRHNVPTTHVIGIMVFGMTFFETTKHPRYFIKSKQYNSVRFGDKTLDTQQIIKMPIPEPYVRFQKVYIWILLEESTLKFLRDAKESFTGSAIHYSMDDILDNKNMRSQMHYLLQNVFQKPSHISVTGPCLGLKVVPCLRLSNLNVLTDSLPNSSRMKLHLWHANTIPEADIHMLLDWLNIGKSVIENPQRDIEQKHIILDRLHRTLILDMVQQIKDAFNDETLMLSDFVVTFVASAENYYSCLEGDHQFILNRISSNGRLSFFTHSQYMYSGAGSGRVYRLWCRVNGAEDLKMATHFRNLSDWTRTGIDLGDYEFYDFNS